MSSLSSAIAAVLPAAQVILGLSLFFAPTFAAQAPDNDPVVELPQFLVTDTRELPPPEAWRYARIPGFEILSNAGDREAQRLIRDFELFKQALSVVWPVPERTHRPTLLILCGRRDAFDAFALRDGRQVDMGSASRFLRNPEQAAIVLDLQLKTLNVRPDDVGADPTGSTDFSQVVVEHNKQLYREYVYHLLSGTSPRAPAWFEEGMAQLIMAMKFDRNTISFGRIEDPNTVSAAAAAVGGVNSSGETEDPDLPALAGAPAEDRDFNVALFRKALVPLDRFFAISHGAPETRNPLGNNRWAKQSYAFVHMCLYGRGGRFQQPFATYLQRLGRGEPATEALFTECFKMNYKRMQLELRSYIEFTDYKHQEFRAKKGEGLTPPATVQFREATQSEVGRIKGEVFVLADKTDEARMAMIAPYTRGERDPELLASLGLLERGMGNEDRSRRFLEAATAASVERPRAHLELARLRFLEVASAPAGEGGKLSAPQVEAVLSPLRAARAQPPPMPALYELAADTWLSAESAPDRDQLLMLFEGVNTFPRRSSLAYKTAVLCLGHGHTNEARALIEFGLANAGGADTRKGFEDLRASLGPQ